jgi:glycosyltransferase involved in cell wall biosynthesis
VNPVLSVPPEPVVGVSAAYFLYAGGMKSRKNVRNIVRAFALFVQKNPDTDTTLVLCGGVRAVYTQSVISLADELGITQRVHFVGFVTPGQLSYLYAHALAFVFPSRIEGFGMAALEAMAIGLPTIASSTGALAEAVGEGALTVDPEQPENIAAAMGRIASDSVLRAELNERGRARAALFSWSIAARETEHLLRSLVS